MDGSAGAGPDPYSPPGTIAPGAVSSGTVPAAPVPAWYPDPYGSGLLRYWDGAAWGALAQAPQPEKTGTDGVAIAALVLSVIGALIPAVACAFVALSRVRRSHRKGRGLAVAALIVSVVWLAVAIPVGLHVASDRSAAGAFAAAPSIPPGTHEYLLSHELVAGQCIEVPDPLPKIPPAFELRGCDAQHNGEVMTTGDLPAGTFPGADEVRATVQTTCRSELASFSGNPNSALNFVYLYPVAYSWERGDRHFVCIAVDRANEVSRTLRGSGI